MTADGVYKLVQAYAEKIGLPGIERLGVHALRATAETNALDHQAQTPTKFPLRIWLAKPTLCRRPNMLPRTRYRSCRSKCRNINAKRVDRSLEIARYPELVLVG
jgi:hypothetical protein